MSEVWRMLTTPSETAQVQLAMALATLLVLLGAIAWRSLGARVRADAPRWLAWAQRALRAALVIAALCSALQYFYGQRNHEGGPWLNRWDLYHQVIGAKYLGELGYFRTYECTWEIDRDHAGHFTRIERMREISSLRTLPTAEVVGARDCAELFTPARHDAFAADIEAMWTLVGPGMWKGIFGDKGFNGTPFHAWTLRALLRGNSLTAAELLPLAWIDVGLLLLAFVVVARVWDVETAAIAGLFFAANFPNNFAYMGGSLLRFDWLAMLIFALAAIKRERWALAGVCVAWATMSRAFPGVLALGLAIKAGVDLIATRELAPGYRRFFAAYALALLTMFMLSLTIAGVEPWHEWFANIRTHTQHTRGFRIGFKHAFMLDGTLADDSKFVGFAGKTANFEPRAAWYALALALLFAPLLLAARRLDPTSFTALFAVFGFVLLLVATRYYYAMLVLALLIDRPLLRDRKHAALAALLVVTSPILYALHEVNPHVPFVFNTACSLVFTGWIVLAGALLWLDPALRDRG